MSRDLVELKPASLRSGATGESLDWHLGHILGAAIAALLGSGIMLGVAVALGGKVDQLWVLAFSQVGLWLGLFGGPVLISRRLGSGSLRHDLGLRMVPVDMVWALLGPVLQLVISLAYAPFVSSEEVERPARELANRAAGSPAQFVLLAIATAIGAPLVEEVFFRGLLLRTLRTKLMPLVAVVVGGVIFSAFHFEPLQFPALAFFGIVAGLLTVRSGRLGPAIWLHIGFNAVTMAALAIDMF